MNQIRVTQAGYLSAWAAMHKQGNSPRFQWGIVGAERQQFFGPVTHWLDGEKMLPEHAERLSRWAGVDRLQSCAQAVRIQGCTVDPSHRARVVCRCCKVPFCPRLQRRESYKWVERMKLMMEATGSKRGYSWKMITVGLKAKPSMQVDIDQHLMLRRYLWDLFRLGYGATSMVGSMEMAGTPEAPHVHLHLLVYSKYIDRSMVQRAMRQFDCTVPGCDHPADTRGTNSACNGSWYADVRKIRCWQASKSNGKKCFCKSAESCQAAGLREAMKYASKPVGDSTVGVPRAGKDPTLNELAWGNQILKFAAHMYKRHRIESYGDAKPAMTMVIADLSQDSEKPLGECLDCGSPVHTVYLGWSRTIRDGYDWAKPRTAGYAELERLVVEYENAKAAQMQEWIERARERRASA